MTEPLNLWEIEQRNELTSDFVCGCSRCRARRDALALVALLREARVHAELDEHKSQHDGKCFWCCWLAKVKDEAQP